MDSFINYYLLNNYKNSFLNIYWIHIWFHNENLIWCRNYYMLIYQYLINNTNYLIILCYMYYSFIYILCYILQIIYLIYLLSICIILFSRYTIIPCDHSNKCRLELLIIWISMYITCSRCQYVSNLIVFRILNVLYILYKS